MPRYNMDREIHMPFMCVEDRDIIYMVCPVGGELPLHAHLDFDGIVQPVRPRAFLTRLRHIFARVNGQSILLKIHIAE